MKQTLQRMPPPEALITLNYLDSEQPCLTENCPGQDSGRIATASPPHWSWITDRQLRTPTSAHTKGRRPIVQVPSVGTLRHCSPPHQTAPVHRITTLRGRLNQRWDEIVASSHWPTKVTPTPASREFTSKLATTHPPQRNASNYITLTHTLTLLAEPVQPVTHSTKISSRPVHDNLARTELHMIEFTHTIT